VHENDLRQPEVEGHEQELSEGLGLGLGLGLELGLGLGLLVGGKGGELI
jgi:hypothetical protein